MAMLSGSAGFLLNERLITALNKRLMNCCLIRPTNVLGKFKQTFDGCFVPIVTLLNERLIKEFVSSL